MLSGNILQQTLFFVVIIIRQCVCVPFVTCYCCLILWICVDTIEHETRKRIVKQINIIKGYKNTNENGKNEPRTSNNGVFFVLFDRQSIKC